MRLFSEVLLFAFLVLLVFGMFLKVPFWLFGLALVVTFAALALCGRFFERHDFARLQRFPQIRFTVTTQSLCITDDFNFKRLHTIGVPNGTYIVECALDEDNHQISGIKVCASDGAITSDEFVLTVDYGLIYVIDGRVIDDHALQRQVRRLAATKLKVPVFEAINFDLNTVGVAVELGPGNGEYMVRTEGGVLECKLTNE